MAAAQASLASSQDQEGKGLAADQAAVDNAQKNLETQAATVQANAVVRKQTIETAKANLHTAQVQRDVDCSHGKLGVKPAEASVLAATNSVDTANAQAAQGQAQDDQTLQHGLRRASTRPSRRWRPTRPS